MDSAASYQRWTDRGRNLERNISSLAAVECRGMGNVREGGWAKGVLAGVEKRVVLEERGFLGPLYCSRVPGALEWLPRLSNQNGLEWLPLWRQKLRIPIEVVHCRT